MKVNYKLYLMAKLLLICRIVEIVNIIKFAIRNLAENIHIIVH